jgi:hypothetical protein
MVAEMVQGWLMDHPVLSWGMTHPIWTGVGVALLFFMSSGLLKAIARLTEQLWMSLLQWPLRLGQWMLNPFFKGLRNQGADESLAPEQLYEIMVRLEHLQQEQTLLLKDIKTLLIKPTDHGKG